MSEEKRQADGYDFARGDMKMSVTILLRNSKLASVPNAEACVGSLRGIEKIADASEGPLSSVELIAMAQQYQAARDELKAVFERLPEGEREEGRKVARQLRTEEQAQMRVEQAEYERGRTQAGLYAR
mmetsp:Transcript_8182/g.18292  ORF Transcript_8182/g.18292 Transcript_8182/m.18292 type:complete len:127 (+) Transcript_8182:328-708(+)